MISSCTDVGAVTIPDVYFACVQPQNSMPDVIIWMLRGEKRVAYSRIPAHQVLYSTFSEQACGQHCGKMQTIFLKVRAQCRISKYLRCFFVFSNRKFLFVYSSIRWTPRAQRCRFRSESTCGWVCPHTRRNSTPSLREPSVCLLRWYIISHKHPGKIQQSTGHLKPNRPPFNALQYENQAQVFGKWGTTGLVGRHKFSDVTGKLKLKQDYFIPPRGWEWESDWFIDPEKA